MTIYRQIVRVPVRNGKPIIDNGGGWLNQNYPNRDPDHQISISFPAYSQDNIECVAIVYCKNNDIIKHLIRDFKLEIVNSNSEADALTIGWKGAGTFKFEDLTSQTTTRKPIDGTTFEEITECCVGCKHNPDGKTPPTVKRKTDDTSPNEKIL